MEDQLIKQPSGVVLIKLIKRAPEIKPLREPILQADTMQGEGTAIAIHVIERHRGMQYRVSYYRPELVCASSAAYFDLTKCLAVWKQV